MVPTGALRTQSGVWLYTGRPRTSSGSTRSSLRTLRCSARAWTKIASHRAAPCGRGFGYADEWAVPTSRPFHGLLPSDSTAGGDGHTEAQARPSRTSTGRHHHERSASCLLSRATRNRAPRRSCGRPPHGRLWLYLRINSGTLSPRSVLHIRAPATRGASRTGRTRRRRGLRSVPVGYHRGLDALRANGWRGNGYVRAQHLTNQGFLRALDGLRRQAEIIGETDEAERCAQFLAQLDPALRPIRSDPRTFVPPCQGLRTQAADPALVPEPHPFWSPTPAEQAPVPEQGSRAARARAQSSQRQSSQRQSSQLQSSQRQSSQRRSSQRQSRQRQSEATPVEPAPIVVATCPRYAPHKRSGNSGSPASRSSRQVRHEIVRAVAGRPAAKAVRRASTQPKVKIVSANS
ncbi:MAG: DUF3151 family protein [Acidimicrobiia bacterium]|nr:DUF3151 family protein [Acidimicrobiia bacterium]